jgi:hypothetical protein
LVEQNGYNHSSGDIEQSLKNLLGLHNTTEEYAVYSWTDDFMDDEEKQRFLFAIQG